MDDTCHRLMVPTCRRLALVLLVFFMVNIDRKKVTVSSLAKISKCHYEGDINIYCNRSKLPASEFDTNIVEHMRSAKATYGLYYNDTLCSYLPNQAATAATCHKRQILNECVDKPYCTVRNGWYSLEPDCAGNAYYTHVDYDCQPVFYMCSETTVVHNIFSGMIYSPGYPKSFRTEKSDTCYLTIHLPKHHHVEITLDYFDMLKTSKCIGDYLDIQQYKTVGGGGGANAAAGESVHHTNNNNNNHANVKHRMQTGRSRYKWQTLGTMCGRIDKPYTIRASADTVNFKFRPLSATHPYVGVLNNYTNRERLGFRIYFQAIPPRAPPLEPDVDDPAHVGGPHSASSTSPYRSPNADAAGMGGLGEHVRDIINIDDDDSSSVWRWTLIVFGISAGSLILAAVLVSLFVVMLKRRRNAANGNRSSIRDQRKSSSAGGRGGGGASNSHAGSNAKKSCGSGGIKPIRRSDTAKASFKSGTNSNFDESDDLTPLNMSASSSNQLAMSTHGPSVAAPAPAAAPPAPPTISVAKPSPQAAPKFKSPPPPAALQQPLTASSSTATMAANQKPAAAAPIHSASLSGPSAASKAAAAGSAAPPPSSSPASNNAANADDSRKFIGELPVLLQDLSSSRLLAKFKQQAAAANAAVAAAAVTSAATTAPPSPSSLSPPPPTPSTEPATTASSAAVVAALPPSPLAEPTPTLLNASASSDIVSTDVNTSPTHPPQPTTISATTIATEEQQQRTQSADQTCQEAKSLPQQQQQQQQQKAVTYEDETMTVTVATNSNHAVANHQSAATTSPAGQKPTTTAASASPNAAGILRQPSTTSYRAKPTEFNPLQLILKDKNKYHTTEFV